MPLCYKFPAFLDHFHCPMVSFGVGIPGIIVFRAPSKDE